MQGRMSLIVFSGTVDKLMAASILATGAAAMGMEVEIFLLRDEPDMIATTSSEAKAK